MAIDKDSSKSEFANLRRRANDRLKASEPKTRPVWTENERQRIIHELDVHQIELEMQNEELRQARNEVEALLEKYSDLYNFAPVGYFTLDRDGVVRAANLTGASILGIERSRLIGRRFGLFFPVNARPLFSEFLGKVFASQGKESCEVTLVTSANSRRFFQVEAVADTSGRECRIAVIDITERRCAEDALAGKRLELEKLNDSLESSIIQAVDDLRRKDQMLIMQDRRSVMGEMINNIAHQWRQPLNALGLINQQLSLFYDTSEFSREFLEEKTGKAMELIQHMSRTIDDFMNFFRLDKEVIYFAICQMISQTLSLIEKSFLDQQIKIDLQIEGNPMVSGYPNEYAQVLLNILMNARDALVEHNVDDAQISIHAYMEGKKSVVTITDNAGGVAESIMDKLFDPYFTTKGPDRGTGIGLFMSKTIIEKNMGGSLTVRNIGNGAEFRIEV